MIESSPEYRAAIVGKSRRIYLRAVIDISDPDKVLYPVQGPAQAPWSRLQQLQDRDFTTPARYVTLEDNRWLLGGGWQPLPDNYSIPGEVGSVAQDTAGDDGTFSTPQVYTQPFSNVSILQACSVWFSEDPVDGVAEDFTVEVLQGGTAYFSQTVTGNRETACSFEGFTVYYPDTLRVTITKWSLPGRRVRMVELVPGVYEQWTGAALAAFSCTQQADFSCLTLPYGTLNLRIDNSKKRFEPRNKSSIFQSVEERQAIEAFIGVLLPDGTKEYKRLGYFYQTGDGWKTSNNEITLDWALVDIVGLLANRTFILPDSLPGTLGGWVAALVAQLGPAFTSRYQVDPAYSSLSVTANQREDVAGAKCGDILRWACMATGTFPRADADTGKLTVEPLWSQGNTVKLTALERYPGMTANESLAALIFKLDGSGEEYVVTGNSTSSEKTVTVQNPFIHSQAQALTAAKQILSCYGGNVYDTTGRGDPAGEIGDVDTLWLDESSAATARRQSQTFQIQDGVLHGCTAKLLQADGSYLFDQSDVVRQSGTWTAPAGVHELRVVLWSGGQGGGYGADGTLSLEHFPMQVVAEYGEPGQDGQGGRVWFGVIPCNEGQTFQVVVGAGGAPAAEAGVPGGLGGDTTFGPWSSANGEYYENGYTDIANGQVFCRPGVAAPLAGSGDGGKGGEGGEPGIGYLYQRDGDIGYRFRREKEPGPGSPGVFGGSGGVMITWAKPAETEGES